MTPQPSGLTTLTIAGLLLAGCSGGDSNDSADAGQDNDSSAISQITPAEDATGVDRSATVEATFDTDVYAPSVGPASLTLASDTLVSGQVDFDATNNRLTFQPDQPLGKLIDYTATVSTTVTDLDGEPLLNSAHTWTFRTEDGEWQPEVDIDDPNEGGSGSASVAVNASGEAVAAWHQNTASDYSIYTARFDPEQGTWDAATLVETDGGNAESASVSMNDDGDIVVAWRQWGGSAYDLRANYYDSATAAWSGATTIDGDAAQVLDARTAIDADGKAVVIWSQNGLRHNTFEPGSGWGTAAPIVDGPSLRRHTLVADADGRFTAVWAQYNNSASRYDLYASRWVDANGWQTPELIETSDVGDADFPSVAVDGAGNLTAVWQQDDGAVYNIHAARFDIDSDSWSTPVLLETEDQYQAQQPHVHANDDGQTLAVWEQADGSRTAIHAAQFDADSGWQTPVEVDPDGTVSASEPVAALDANGNAWVAWIQPVTDVKDLVASRRAAGDDWQAPVELDTEAGYASAASLSVAGNGDTLLVWRQSDAKARWFE